MTAVLAAVLVVCVALLGFEAWLLYLMVRQQGRVLLAHEELRDRLATTESTLQRLMQLPIAASGPPQPQAQPAVDQPAALPLGSLAPDFRLPDLKGRVRTLLDYRGRPAVLVFFNPDCGFCTQLAPILGELPAAAPQLVVMTRGDKAVNRRLAKQYGWRSDVLLEPGWEVATRYGTNATPTAYLVDAEGRISSTLGVGVEGVLALTRMFDGKGAGHDGGLTAESLKAKQDAAVEKARAAGLAITESGIKRDGLPAGTLAPDFTLPDVTGREHSLADLRGKPILLVFSDPACGPCEQLAPALEQLHQAHRYNNLQVLMVSKGDLEANREKVRQHNLTFPVLLQRNWEISMAYAMFATPVGYLIDERGIIAKDVAIGGDAVLRLANG